MFDLYVLDYYDEVDGQHFLRSESNLLELLRYVSLPFIVGSWQIFKGEIIEGVFYPQRLIARSALETDNVHKNVYSY